jgi:hypothetical protein
MTPLFYFRFSSFMNVICGYLAYLGFVGCRDKDLLSKVNPCRLVRPRLQSSTFPHAFWAVFSLNSRFQGINNFVYKVTVG